MIDAARIAGINKFEEGIYELAFWNCGMETFLRLKSLLGDSVSRSMVRHQVPVCIEVCSSFGDLVDALKGLDLVVEYDDDSGSMNVFQPLRCFIGDSHHG